MPPKKRGRGRPRGSVYWHDGSQRWCAQTPPDRRARRRSRYFADEEAAWAWLDLQLDAIDDGRDVFAVTEPLGTYLTRWIDTAENDPERDLAQNTLITYRWAIACLASLHTTPIEDLTRSRVDAEMAAIARARGLKSASIRIIRTVLHAALEDLVDDEVISRNPARRGRARRAPEPDERVVEEIAWSEHDARTFLEHARHTPRAALWWLVTSCGLRNGELRALELDDLDTKTWRLWVRYTANESGRKRTRTKGRRNRPIDLPQNVIDALRAHLKARRALGGRIFQSDDGGPLRGRELRHELHEIRRMSGVPPVARVHDLRHVAASIMLANGYQLALIAHILGHRSTSTTSDVYIHIVPRKPIERPRNIADVLPFAPRPSSTASGPAVHPAVALPPHPEATRPRDLTTCYPNPLEAAPPPGEQPEQIEQPHAKSADGGP